MTPLSSVSEVTDFLAALLRLYKIAAPCLCSLDRDEAQGDDLLLSGLPPHARIENAHASLHLCLFRGMVASFMTTTPGFWRKHIGLMLMHAGRWSRPCAATWCVYIYMYILPHCSIEQLRFLEFENPEQSWSEASAMLELQLQLCHLLITNM